MIGGGDWLRALLIGLAIAAVLFVVTGGHVQFLPLLLIPFGGWHGDRGNDRAGGVAHWPEHLGLPARRPRENPTTPGEGAGRAAAGSEPSYQRVVSPRYETR